MSKTTKLRSQDDVTVIEPGDDPVFEPYESPAGGWGALHATAKALREQSIALKGSKALLSMNQPDGFDCPGCAWPDPQTHQLLRVLRERREGRRFRADEAARDAGVLRRAHRERARGAERLLAGGAGAADRADALRPRTDHYVPVSWDEAFALIGRELRALADPNEAEFYTSGRTSNEAAFLYQLFVRRFGTNNFPDCSNMCHEPTSVGLPESIGIGKGTVLLDDFAHAEAIFVIGQNPGHQQSADDDRTAQRIAPRRADRGVQSAARAGARTVRRAAGPGGDGHLRLDAASPASIARCASAAMSRRSRA